MQSKNDRQSNYELLRIILMLMIVCIHYIGHGGIRESAQMNTVNYYFSYILEGFCEVAVSTFIILLGYFQCKKKFNFKRILSLEFQALTYSIGILLIFLIVGKKVGLNEITADFLPVIRGKWWFLTSYFILYCLTPFMNELLNNLNKRRTKALILFLFITFSVIPTITFFKTGIPESNIVNFIILYYIGAYIKKYYNPNKKINMYLVAYLFFCLIGSGLNLLLSIYFKQDIILFWKGNSSFVMIPSVCIFIFFIKLRLKNKYINRIAKNIFAVYLIHDNTLVREVIYPFFKVKQYSNSNLLIMNLVFTISVIFISCIIIEEIRVKVFSGLENKIIEWIFSRINLNKESYKYEKI